MNNEMTTDNMSNEEVIEVLKGLVFGSFDRTTRKERQALDLAIKALEERPQGDLISRSELKKCAIPCQIHNGALTDLCVPLYQIDNAPTVDCYTFTQVKELFDLNVQMADEIENLKRPQGEWIEQTKYPYAYNCTNCGFENTHKANFCEKCGADMKKGGAE